MSMKGDPLEKKEVNLEDFTLLCLIGKGPDSKITLVKHSTGKVYAMKAIKKEQMKQ